MIETIESILTGALGPFGPVIAVGILGIFMILLTIPMMLQQKKDPLDKLKKEEKSPNKLAEKQERLRAAKANRNLEKYSSFLEPQNAEQYSSIRLKLLQAGYPGKDSVRIFHLAQFALGLIGLIGGLVYFVMTNEGEVNSQDAILTVLGPAGAGYFLPKYWITRRIEERKEEIISGFPDALDMMLVCVEAGQSLDQSIVRVGKELRASYPALATEFEIVAYEMKAGKDKVAVLNDMSERCGVQDVSSFVTVLIQSTTFGTSIAEALRVYAGEMRDKRVMRAEEKANKLPTKMTLATMMLTVPPLLIILVGPSVVSISQLGEVGPGGGN